MTKKDDTRLYAVYSKQMNRFVGEIGHDRHGERQVCEMHKSIHKANHYTWDKAANVALFDNYNMLGYAQDWRPILVPPKGKAA